MSTESNSYIDEDTYVCNIVRYIMEENRNISDSEKLELITALMAHNIMKVVEITNCMKKFRKFLCDDYLNLGFCYPGAKKAAKKFLDKKQYKKWKKDSGFSI